MSEYVTLNQDVVEAGFAFILTEDYYLKLYTNAATLRRAMVPGDFTEASGGGYAHKTIDSSGDFTAEYANDPPDIILPEQQFDFTSALAGNASVIGWILINQGGTVVRAAKKLDTAYTPASGGGVLKFTPRIQSGNAVTLT